MNKTVTAAAVAAAMLAGAGASAAIFVPHLAGADTGTSTSTSTPGYDGHGPGPGGPGGFGGRHELVSDESVAAKAIGISEADLKSALQSGKTMADVAKAHNVDPKKVIDALVADGQSELADQVKNGRLTQAQADEMKTHLTQHATDQVNGKFRGGPGGPGGPRGPGGPHAAAVAKAIGISEADLRSALQSGKTIADVAKAHSVDPKKVIDALVTDEQSELADQVKNGRLTQAQADEMKTHVTQHATDEVNGTFHGGPRLHDGPGGRGGFGGPGGPGPDGPGRVDNPSTAPSSASV
jgi:transposase-like protein